MCKDLGVVYDWFLLYWLIYHVLQKYSLALSYDESVELIIRSKGE